jgi:FkbM family methyltransferase
MFRTLARPAELVYNAAFTPEGRRNVKYRWRLWRLRTFTKFGEGQAATYRRKDGTRFVVHPNDALSRQIYCDGDHEPLESAIVRSVLQAGDTVLDVGANTGYYTSLFSDCVGKQGHVFSIEAGPQTFAKLTKTIELLHLGNVTAFQKVASDHDGWSSFVTSMTGDDAQQSIVDWEHFAGDKRQLDKIPSISLDSLLADARIGAPGIAFLKCDVEGAECKVLAGAGQIMRSASPPIVLVEGNASALQANGGSIEQLLRYLDGYRIYYTPLDIYESKARCLNTPQESLPDLINIIGFPLRGTFSNRFNTAKVRGLLTL